MNDTFVVTTALEVVWILRNMKEYDATIALGELYTDGLEHYLAAYGTKDAKYLIPCFQYLKEANVETPPATVKRALDKNMSYMLQYFNLKA